MTITVIAMHGVSIALMLTLLYEYRHIHAKRMELLQSLSDRTVTHFLWERRLLMGTYIALTLLISVISIALYVFQPHLL